MLAKASKQIVALHAGLLTQRVEDVAEPAAGIGAGRERLVGAARRRHRPARTAGRHSLTAATLERLVGKQAQERHHQRRHAAAATARLRLALPARTVEHAVENITQSHLYLLLSAAEPAPLPASKLGAMEYCDPAVGAAPRAAGKPL